MSLKSRIAAALGLLVLCSSALAEENAKTLVTRYSTLTAGSPVAVSNLVVKNGAMTITLANGSAAPVKAGDETIGFFFKGDGSFDYAADAVETPIVKTNLRNTKSSATLNGSTIHGTLTDALIVADNVALPALTGAAASAPMTDVFAANRVAFDNDLDSQLAPQLAYHKLSFPALPFFRAEFRGADEWAYTMDHEDETLDRLYTIDFDERARRIERYEAPIGGRGVGRTRNDPHPYTVMLTDVDYALTATDDRNATISTTETFLPRIDGMRSLFLILPHVLHAERGTTRSLEVQSITAADGTALPYSHDTGTLLVSLPQPTSAGVPIKITFNTAGDILRRPAGDNYWLLRSWFPQPPEMSGNAMTAHGVIKVKAPFVAFAGGKTVSRKTDGDFNVVESKLDQPTSFVFIAGGKYWSEEETRNGRTIRVSAYGQKNPRASKQLIALSFDIINYYEYFLGPFPADELNIVGVNTVGFGQSPAGMIFISNEAFAPLMGEENQDYSHGVNQRIAHEIAHQYWGNAVRWTGDEDQWMSESFAEYSSAILFRKFKGQGAYDRMRAEWKASAKESAALAPIPFANRITTPNNYDENRDKLIYGKGPVLLAALHKQVGDETFLVFLKSFQKSFHNKAATTRDVAGLLGFITKKDFKPFFDQYFWGTDVPDVK